MRIGRTSTYCLLALGVAYTTGFVACGGSSGEGDGNTGTGNNPTSTTIVITGGNTGGAGGAGSGGAGGGNTGGSAGGVIIDGDAACVAEPRAGEQIPLDLFFMVDKSGSMTCPVGAAGMRCTATQNPIPAVNRWTSIRDALNTFATSTASANLGMGMAFFPLMANGNSGALLCNPQDYATPAVPIGILPGTAGAVQTALNANMPNGNTPTVPALSGAIQYATGYAQTHTGRTVAVVFASDGEPTECMNNNTSIPGAVNVARAALMGTPPIRTYVLGVGPSLGNLNQIAAAGGTTQAFLVESGGSQDLINALNDIRKSALTCDYQIPVIPGRPLDLNLVNIKARVGPAPAMEQIIYKVDGASSCGSSGGWYFDNPSAPTKITLCPTTCDPLIKTQGSKLDVLIGCKAVVRPPN
ncbi:MAG: vWA domain-containing protein [Polyangiaceae bacterium]